MKALNYPILNNEFERVGMVLQGEYSHPEIVEDLESGFPTFSMTVSKADCEDISKIQDNTYTIIDNEIYSLLSSDDIDRHEKDLFYEHWAVPYLQAEAESIEEPTSDQDAGFYFEKTLEDTPIALGNVEVQKKKTLAFSAGKVGSRLHDLYREFAVEPIFSTRFNPYNPTIPVGITLDLVQERGSKETGIVLDSETNLIKINRKMNKDELLTGIKVKPFTKEENVTKTVKTAQQSVEIKAQPKVEQKQVKSTPAWPTKAGLPITSAYGPRRAPTAGASTWHAAIDIGGGNTNHPIYATQDGEVIHSVYNQYGNTIRIKHSADKYYSQYMHLASRSVSVGQKVKRGQRIGTMGTTGISTGIHLDFAISKNGTFYQQTTTIDPREYLKMEFTTGTASAPSDDGLPEKTRKQLAYFDLQAGGTYTQSGARNNYIDNQGRVINKAPADCSSLVYKSLIFAGIPCGFSANNAWKGTTYTLRDQSSAGQYFNIVKNWNQLEPGDIILCNNWGHVVTYVGGGRVFHASRPGVPHGYASASTYQSRVNRIIRPKDRGSRTIKKTQATTQKVDSTLIGGSNRDQVWVHLKRQGYGDAQAAMVMGNIYQESRYDPKAQQGGGRLPGRGLVQWSVNDRWQGLLSYASDKGLDSWGIEAQVGFIKQEMRYTGYVSTRMNDNASRYGGKKAANGFAALHTINNIEQGTRFICEHYEIAGIAMMSVRVNEAKKIYKEYKGTYENAGEEETGSVTVGDIKYTTKEVSEKEEVTYSIKDIILEEDDFYSFQGQETIYSRKAQEMFGFNQQNKSYYLMGVHEMNSTNVTGEFESALLKLKEKSKPFEEYVVDLDTTDPDTREALQAVQLGDKLRVTSHGWERNEDLVLVARVSQVIRRPGERENIGVRITDAERLEVFLPDHIRGLQERIARADAEDFDRMQVVLRSDIVNFIGQGDETEIVASVRNSGADYTHQIPDAEFKWQVYDKNGIPISETEEHDIVVGSGLQNDAGNSTWRTAELVDGNRYRIHPTIIGTEYRFDTYDVDGNAIDSTEWLDDKEDVVYVAPAFASYMVVEAKTNPNTRPFQVLAEATPLIMEGKKVFISADMVDERITVTCSVREAEGSISLSKTDYTHVGANPPSDYRPGSEFLKEVPGTGVYDENGNWTGEFEKLMFDGHEWVNQDVNKLEKELELEFFEFGESLKERDKRQQAILDGLGVKDISETDAQIRADIQAFIASQPPSDDMEITFSDGSTTTWTNFKGDYKQVTDDVEMFRSTLGSTEEEIASGITGTVSDVIQSSDIIQLSVGKVLAGERKGMIGDVILENSSTEVVKPRYYQSWYLPRSLVVGNTYYVRVRSTVKPVLYRGMAGVSDVNLGRLHDTADEWELVFEYKNTSGSPTHEFRLANLNSAAGEFQILELYQADPEATGTKLTILSNSASLTTQNLIGDTLAELGIINSDGYFSGDRFMFNSDVKIANDFKLQANHIEGNIMDLIEASFEDENGNLRLDANSLEVMNKTNKYSSVLEYGRMAFINADGQESSRLGIFSTDGGVTYKHTFFQSNNGEIGIVGSDYNGHAIGGFKVDKEGSTRFDGAVIGDIRFKAPGGRDSGSIGPATDDPGHIDIYKVKDIDFRHGHGINSRPDYKNLNLSPSSGRTIQLWGNMDANGWQITGQSDMRLKKNIKPTKREGIKWTKRQLAIDFEWDEKMKANEGKPEGEHFSILAQYAGEVATNTNKDSHYQSIKFDELAYMNLLTNQELIDRVEELEARVEALDG